MPENHESMSMREAHKIIARLTRLAADGHLHSIKDEALIEQITGVLKGVDSDYLFVGSMWVAPLGFAAIGAAATGSAPCLLGQLGGVRVFTDPYQPAWALFVGFKGLPAA